MQEKPRTSLQPISPLLLPPNLGAASFPKPGTVCLEETSATQRAPNPPLSPAAGSTRTRMPWLFPSACQQSAGLWERTARAGMCWWV